MTIPESTIIDRWTHLSGELVDGYALCERVRVHVYPEGDEYVASLNDVPIIAYGSTQSEALHELRREIVEYIYLLEDAGERLSPRLRRERDHLRSIVQLMHG